MPTVEFKDGDGNSVKYMDIDGIYYPFLGHTEETTRQTLKTAVGRADDILLLNYPKSGTHWLWEILCMLQQGAAETIPQIKQTHYLEALSPEELATLPSPRVLNSHIRFDRMSDDMKQNRVKVVLLHRNPKDVAVSLYNMEKDMVGIFGYDGTWENWFQRFLEGKVLYSSWFDFVLDWEQVLKDNPDYPIHLLFYEDLKENSPKEIQRLAQFLNISVSDELCEAIAIKCDFDQMKIDKAGLENEFWKSLWRNKKPKFYRKGRVGDWKNWFTVAQNEQMDTILAKKMENSQLKFKFELRAGDKDA